MGVFRTVTLAAAVVLCSAAITRLALAGGEHENTTLAARTGRAFTVTSTLDGRKALPMRIRWIAEPRIPASQVADVEFRIDGTLRWIEHTAPYVYGGDNNGADEGFLFTSWLTPGEHRFTASVTDMNGLKSSDTVTARVLPAQRPPVALVGTWTRVVTARDAQKAQTQPGGGPPLGTWKLVFDRVGVWELDPKGGGVVDGYDAEPGIIHVYAPIQMTPPIGQGGISRFGHHIYTSGGTDCTDAGPFGTYRWSVTGATLTLAPIHEGCSGRGALWEGSWTRTTTPSSGGGSNP
jgi:hypothetical protein